MSPCFFLSVLRSKSKPDISHLSKKSRGNEIITSDLEKGCLSSGSSQRVLSDLLSEPYSSRPQERS